MYDNSMKYKWDNKNVRDYEVKEAELKGEQKGEHKRALAIVGNLKKESFSVEFISETTRLNIEEIEKL